MLERAAGVPGLDVPGLDTVSIARGYGCDAARVADLDALKQAATAARTKEVPTTAARGAGAVSTADAQLEYQPAGKRERQPA